uniref:DUF3447 domain-containing protein n=1 Tax=viral metagenome TaxID=1070528 RepID=A0A6C0KUV4_9ZZZZ
MSDPFFDFFMLCLKNNEEKVFSFLEKENPKLNVCEICAFIRGGTNTNILSRVIEEENSQFFETAVMANRIDVFYFLRQRYPNFKLDCIIRQLFFQAFVENENWEMTKTLEDCGFPLRENLCATFLMQDGGDKFKRYYLSRHQT